MDKRMFSLLLILVVIFIGFTLATENNVLTVMDTSDIFTTQEVKLALDGLKDGMKQWKGYDDITMLFTHYDEDDSLEKTEEYLDSNEIDANNVIVLKAKFYVHEDHEGALTPGERYNGTFILTRTDADAPWVLAEWYRD